MPTVDITASPYNAVADGGYSFGAFTILEGAAVLSSASALWDPDNDVGKSIVVGRAGGGAGEPGGGTPLRATINSVAVDGKSVTLSANAVSALPTTEDVIVAWGTNNDTAFQNFREYYLGASVDLTIPAGVYLISRGNFGGLFEGIGNITVSATGATIAGGSFGLGGGAQYAASGHAARTISVTAGSSSVTLSTPSEVSRFSTGLWCMMTGLSLQYSGYPSNHQRYEPVLITAIDADSGSPTYGKITFSAPLVNTYLSTWPLFDASGPDYGGPATLYDMNFSDFSYPAAFNQTLVVNDLTVAHHSQFGIRGLSATLNNCVFKGLYGPYPTIAKTVALNDCTGVDCTMEVDKYVDTVTMTGCTWKNIAIQSAVPNLFTIDSTAVTGQLAFSPKKVIIQNGCNIADFVVGPSYGFSSEVVASDSVISHFGALTYHSGGRMMTSGENDNTGIIADFDMTDGVMIVPNSWKNYGYIEQWMVTGANVFWFDANVGTIGRFTITDVTQDVTNCYVHTDWSGGFPSRSYGVLGLWLLIQPNPICTFSNVTGCAEIVDLTRCTAGAPLYSETNRVYDQSDPSGTYWQLYGEIKYIKVIVTVASTQSGAVTATLGNTYCKVADYSNASYAPTIDLKTTGTRILDVTNGAYPGVWSGGVGADNLPNLTEALWSCSNYRVTTTTVANALERATFSVQFITDQGIVIDSVSGERTFHCRFV